MPPKPAEAAKVQPKKETVRINLPPKPTSAPTIKLPTLAPGGPPSSGGTAEPVAAPAAPRAAAPPPPSSPTRVGTTSATRPSAPSAPVQQRPAPYVAPAAGVGKLDKALAIAAAVVVLAAVGSTVWLFYLGGIQGIIPGN